MERLKRLLKRYRAFVVLAVITVGVLIVSPEIGGKALNLTWKNALEMMSVIPPIFILLGLLDVWLKKETMLKYMGEHAGFLGAALAFLMGSAAAGPLYGAFPVAGLMLKKGSKFSNVLIMVGAWSTTKIPLLLFEASAMGTKFTITRLVLNLFGIAAIAFVTARLLSKSDRDDIYQRAIDRL